MNKKKKNGKPIDLTKLNLKPINLEIEGLTQQEKVLHRDLIVKRHNYFDMFSDHEAILELTGNTSASFKRNLYDKNIQILSVIYNEIRIAFSQSKEYEMFLKAFSSTVYGIAFVYDTLLGIPQ